ncbi:MAG: hypothetical protein CVT66_09005 [Actinobacteria bacterium HGW-Actinobacteria-6]|nr:MAG: hypothetical protein CVT66_09005 [Actinobacteria bacterium HGW-Actinobacteria-6]
MEIKRAAEGLTIIAVGFIFLGNTFGVIPWGVWWNIASLWPILLIAAGIDVIGRGTDNTWLRVLSSLLVIAGLAYGVFMMPTGNSNWSPWGPFVVTPMTTSGQNEAFSESRPHDPAVLTGEARVSGAVGTLKVKDGSDLVSVSGDSPFTPEFKVTSSARGADVNVGMGSGHWVAPRDNASLDVKLDRTVTWDLTIDGGVSKIDADLSSLTISALEVKAGVSSGTVILGAAESVASGGVPVNLDTGVSTFTLRIKRGEQVRLRVDKGLSNIVRPDELTSVGEDGGKQVYETADLAGGDYWDITLDAGISNVRIEFY